MGVNMLYTEFTLKPYDILKVKYKPHFNAVCTKQFFMFVSLDSYDSKIQCLSSFFYQTHTVLFAHYSSLTSNWFATSNFCGFSIQILFLFKKPNIFGTFKVTVTTK